MSEQQEGIRLALQALAKQDERDYYDRQKLLYDPEPDLNKPEVFNMAQNNVTRFNPVTGKARQILESLTPGEPVFVFRGQDILSTMVLMHYATLVEGYSPHSEMVEGITEAINKFRDWQHANPQKVKLPD